MKLLPIYVGILIRRKRTKTAKGRAAQRHRVDGAKLRKLREDAELSIRALALGVGVDPSTIADLEAGKREWSQLRVVRSIAAHPAIDVDYRDLLLDEKPSARPKATPLPPRSSLDLYVDEERRLGPRPRIAMAKGELPLFGAVDLVRVFSAPASVAGQLFAMRGVVHATRGLSITDGIVLGIDHQDGSRFEILRSIGTVEKPLSFTVITINVGDTRALHELWERQAEATFAIRVITTRAVPHDHDRIAVVGLGDAPHVRVRRHSSEIWRGFYQIEAKTATPPKPHPWALLVEVGSINN